AADIKTVKDVPSSAWYAKDMAKAVQMHTFALDTKMRPNDKITRQEAFAVLARAFKLASTDVNNKALDKFGDKADIASWALKDLNGMAEAGYIKGSPNGNLNPKANITRAEFAVVMDSLVKQYIDKAGTVTEVATSGNVMIRTAGVTLKGVTVKGDLIIGDGVGDGDAVLDGVKVEGRTVVRGGGINSIIIRGNSNVGSIIVSKTTGEVRVSVEGGADVEIIYVDDGSDDVIVQGSIGTLEVAGDNVTVTATEAAITKAIISGEKSAIAVEKGSAISTVTISGANAAISGQGEVKTVSVVAGGNNTSITTPNTVTEVASDVSGVTAGGKEVPAGSTATNNATGTDATVTQPSTGGGGGGGSVKHLTINKDKEVFNIDDFDGKVLNKSLVALVETMIGHDLYLKNISKFGYLNYSSFDDKFTGTFLDLKDATEENLGDALKLVAGEIAKDTTDRYGVLDEARTISESIATNANVTYNNGTTTKTLKSITVEACGKTCVVYLAGGSILDGQKIKDLYDAVKDNTLSQIALAGTAKVTIVANDGTKDVTKVFELKYE
ncbi:MAG: S-layer homology domain-containing protein, partial [Eubacteriales bacterium]|nr:S-layer homology domain-containing protein [Eubacteriales bacterium]